MDPPAPVDAAKKKGAENPNKVQQPNKKKGLGKKRKPPRKKASGKGAKRARRKDKTLKPATGVPTVPVDGSDHGSVLHDVGKAGGKTTKKSKKSNKGKPRVISKAQAEPSGSGGGVGDGDLPVSGNNATDEVVRNKSDNGLYSPRRGNDGGEDGEAGGAKAHLLDQKESHHSDWQLEAEPETEVGEENVEDTADVANIVNWEHYGLMFEEYCLTREVNYTKK